MSFLATLDNLSGVTTKQAKETLTNLFVKVCLAANDNSGDFTEEQVQKFASLVCEFHDGPNDGDHVSGEEAEKIYHDAYQTAWRKEMGVDEDSDSWNGEIDWRKFHTPEKVLKRVGAASGYQEAIDTKAFYKYVKDHPEEFPSA